MALYQVGIRPRRSLFSGARAGKEREPQSGRREARGGEAATGRATRQPKAAQSVTRTTTLPAAALIGREVDKTDRFIARSSFAERGTREGKALMPREAKVRSRHHLTGIRIKLRDTFCSVARTSRGGSPCPSSE